MSNTTITKNAFSNMLGMFIQMTIAFLLSPFLVHTLGDTKYGIWTIAVAFTGYMNLMDLGISSAINKYVAKYQSVNEQEKINSLLSTALALFVILATVIILISPFMANVIVHLINFDESLIETVYLLIIIVSFDIAVFIIRGLYRGIFGGFQRYEIINITLVITSIYKAIMFYFFLKDGYGLISMGVISISANLLALTTFFFLLRKTFPEVKFTRRMIRKNQATKILNYSKYTFLAMFANQVIYYSDAFVIGYFMTAAAVTYYSIPWTLSEYAKKISYSISQTYVPAVSNISAIGDFEKVKALYLSGTKYMLIISNLISVGVFILGGAFISIWMGPEYREKTETVLLILFVNQLFLGPQQISYSILQGLSKQKIYSYMSVVVSVLNLCLSIILVQQYGIIGVAIGAVIPQVLFNGIFVPLLTLKTVKISVWVYLKSTYLLSLASTVVLLACLYVMNQMFKPDSYADILFIGFSCTFIYTVCVYLTMLNVNEKRLIIRQIKRIIRVS